MYFYRLDYKHSNVVSVTPGPISILN